MQIQYITCYYFHQNDLDILTNAIEFKNFKNGLRRTMKGDICPNAKQPFDPQQLVYDFGDFLRHLRSRRKSPKSWGSLTCLHLLGLWVDLERVDARREMEGVEWTEMKAIDEGL